MLGELKLLAISATTTAIATNLPGSDEGLAGKALALGATGVLGALMWKLIDRMGESIDKCRDSIDKNTQAIGTLSSEIHEKPCIRNPGND